MKITAAFSPRLFVKLSEQLYPPVLEEHLKFDAEKVGAGGVVVVVVVVVVTTGSKVRFSVMFV
jgi:hypothetical protein